MVEHLPNVLKAQHFQTKEQNGIIIIFLLESSFRKCYWNVEKCSWRELHRIGDFRVESAELLRSRTIGGGDGTGQRSKVRHAGAAWQPRLE